MKAIHNYDIIVPKDDITVVMLSKIGKMKAIHNDVDKVAVFCDTVVMLSKIGKMKAIHNFCLFDYFVFTLL